MSVPEPITERQNLTKTETKSMETLPFEYQWPQENAGEYYLLATQVCEYLKEDDLLQKYPEVQRHEVSKDERKFLLDHSAVTEAEFHDEKKKVSLALCSYGKLNGNECLMFYVQHPHA